MSNPKRTHELIRQNEQIVKKSQKHDANLQKNSTLYFQIGLIVCLLAAYGLFEMKFETTIPKIAKVIPPDENDTYVFNDIVKVYDEQAEKVEKKKKSVIFKNPIIKEDQDDSVETPEIFTEAPVTSNPISPDDVPLVIDVPTNIPVSCEFVEEVPIYPGCENEKTNLERRKCMSKKITKLIQRKFNSSIASDYGLSGRQRINVQFKIDKTGHVTNIKARAPHPKLKDEAERVINKIPEMIPGKQSNKAVGVIYTLPIIFQVN
jgi:protein TonB